MKIRAKIGVLAVGLSVAVAGVAAAGFYLTERRTLLRKMAEAHTAMADHLAQTCRDALVVKDELAALNAAAAVRGNVGVVDAYCLDGKGRLVAHADTALLGKIPRSLVGRDLVPISVPVTKGPARKAVVIFSKTAMDREVDQALRDVLIRLLPPLGAALGLGLLGAWLLALHLTRPIQRIARGTHRLAAGELDHRLTETRADELGDLAQDFNHMAIKLGELDQMKREFVARVTHELRSPLSAIESYANFMMEEIPPNQASKAINNLAIIRNNATRLGRFVNDILDLSKIESRAMDIRQERFNVMGLFNELTDLFGPVARERHVQLQINVPPGLTVIADRDKIHQAMTNLIGNALKFTPSGGEVILSAGASNPFQINGEASHIRMTVSDTGPGIPPKDQKRIFDKFEQARGIPSAHGGVKGTGLGLSIVKGLVEVQGGVVTLESDVGRGSRFSLHLPE
ncbi:MAG: HAMP domain-containing histidine kinase [Elusimicrobia bacterium]|jgi:signal transduction histidine kinase|nr:HAMP domain-containing histidine kinase [Elusimicrobiota bacterium]